jgi:stress response protein SCP2
MISLTRGQKVKLADLTSALRLEARMNFDAPQLNFDFSCFGLDESGQLSDDRYFIFYNQRDSPENALQLASSSTREAHFTLDLAQLPKSVLRLFFVATVDGPGQMSGLQSGKFSLSAENQIIAEFAFVGADFSSEKAIMVGEIYFKDQWRIAANGQGFKEGLSAVLRHFGGQEIEDGTAEQMELAPKVNPEKTGLAAVDFAPDIKLTPTLAPVVPVAAPGANKPVNLQKNQTVSLSKIVPTGLRQIRMGLGWDPAQRGRQVDLDASCIAFDSNKKVLETIWFGNLSSRDKTIKHSGDNLTGRGEGDDEVISVDLTKLASNIQTLVFTINSFTGQKFSALKNTFCRVVNSESRAELARYDLGSAGNVTGMIMAKVERKNGEWEMTAIGEPAGGITVHFLVKAVRKVI